MKNSATAHVTTANLATAHVAMSTLVAAERLEERSESNKKIHKIMMSKSSHSDKSSSNLIHSTTVTTVEAITTVTSQTKCSVQEGVRMMVTSSMLDNSTATSTSQPLGNNRAQAILNPPANVQKAIVVTQNLNGNNSTGKMMANIASGQLRTFGALAGTNTKPMKLKAAISLEIDSEKLKQDKPKPIVISPNGKFFERFKFKDEFNSYFVLRNSEFKLERTKNMFACTEDSWSPKTYHR